VASAQQASSLEQGILSKPTGCPAHPRVNTSCHTRLTCTVPRHKMQFQCHYL